MRVFLNSEAAYGAGGRRWAGIESDLRRRLGGMVLEKIESPAGLSGQVRQALDEGERIFVAAGGDGTVNLLINALMKSRVPTAEVTIGAVGLGSSNDFHKPLTGRQVVSGIPLRVDVGRATPVDVIRMKYRDEDGQSRERFCLLNASIGVTAEANHCFNGRQFLLRMVQTISVEVAIGLTALLTIAGWRNIPCTIRMDDGTIESVAVTNLGMVKSPHFAGRLVYPPQVQPDDGMLGLNLCQGMSRMETVGLLLALHRQRFSGRSKTRSLEVRRIEVESDRLFALEGDGEVIRTDRVELSVVPRAVRCCR